MSPMILLSSYPEESQLEAFRLFLNRQLLYKVAFLCLMLILIQGHAPASSQRQFELMPYTKESVMSGYLKICYLLLLMTFNVIVMFMLRRIYCFVFFSKKRYKTSFVHIDSG